MRCRCSYLTGVHDHDASPGQVGIARQFQRPPQSQGAAHCRSPGQRAGDERLRAGTRGPCSVGAPVTERDRTMGRPIQTRSAHGFAERHRWR